MTRKFLLYSSPIVILFMTISLFEPWIYRELITSDKIDDRLKGEHFDIIAHKGASGIAPENTIAAIQLALDMGVDMIEIDVRNTHDEEIVVIHDATLDRTTNGTGLVHDYTLEEIRELDAGSWFGDARYAGEKVPTLKEVLDLVDGCCAGRKKASCASHRWYWVGWGLDTVAVVVVVVLLLVVLVVRCCCRMRLDLRGGSP